MTIAHILLVHRLPEQVARIASRLTGPDAAVLVHVDRKVDAAPFERAFADAGVQVTAIERHECHWGGFGHVAATISGLRAALELPFRAEHVVVSTGQDYPLLPPGKLAQALEPETTYMEFSRLPRADGGVNGLDRIQRRFFRIRGRWTSLPNDHMPLLRRRPIPLGLEPYQGGAYWFMHRAAAEYVVGFLDEHPELARYFRRSLLPEENLFQMILLNSPLADRVVNEERRFIDWSGADFHPAVLTADDFPRIAGSGKLFARKVDLAHDRALLDMIDRELLGIAPELGAAATSA